RRVLAGERDLGVLAEGLDDTDRLILASTLRRLCAAAEDWQGTVEAAQALIALGAGDADTWAALAGARANLGDEAAAAEAYAQAVALAPEQAMLRRNYADALIKLKRLDEAAAQLDAAEKLEPDAPYLALRRAQLAQAAGDRAAALRWAEEALRPRPGWDEAERMLGNGRTADG
ncbi:MAG: tetratricopeptide repeat protein, partial [Anaerolineae bacterium]